jgi:hypothetical protein
MLLVVDSLDNFIAESNGAKVYIAVNEEETAEKKVCQIALTSFKDKLTRLNIYVESSKDEKGQKEYVIDVEAALKGIHAELIKAKLDYAPGMWYA